MLRPRVQVRPDRQLGERQPALGVDDKPSSARGTQTLEEGQAVRFEDHAVGTLERASVAVIGCPPHPSRQPSSRAAVRDGGTLHLVAKASSETG